MNIACNLDLASTARILNLRDATTPQEPATLAQLNALAEGLAWKDNARVATAANINLASPGASIDGITLALNDRVLVRAQTAPAENGLYIYNGAAVPLTRSADADTPASLTQSVVSIDEGTSAGSTYRQSTVQPTLGTSPVAWAPFGVVAPPASTSTPGLLAIATQAQVNAGTATDVAVTPETLKSYTGYTRKFSADIGDGSATAYAVTHNLGTRDVQVQLHRTSGNYDIALADIEITTTNSVTIKFAAAPALNAWRVVVIG